GKWPHARRVMKQEIEAYATKNFYFDLTFMVRMVTGIVRGRALFETIHNVTEGDVKSGWKRLTKTLDYLVAILPKHAFVHSTEDLNTTNVLVPLVVYLESKGKFESDAELRRAVHWLYAASTWARYTSQTNQRLDHDLSIVKRSLSPWQELVE